MAQPPAPSTPQPPTTQPAPPPSVAARGASPTPFELLGACVCVSFFSSCRRTWGDWVDGYPSSGAPLGDEQLEHALLYVAVAERPSDADALPKGAL